MASLSNWFFQLSGRWKAIGLAFGLLGAGFTAGSASTGFLKIPDRVTTLEQRADSLNAQLKDIRHDVAELRHSNSIQLCLQIAEKRHTDWQECLK